MSAAISTTTNPRSLYLGPGGGVIDNGGIFATVIWGGAITGPGVFSKNNGGGNYLALTFTNQFNTYSGGTFVSGSEGWLSVVPDSSLGVGDVTVAGTLWLFGDKNIGGGDMTTATDDRNARLSIEPSGAVYFMSANPSVGSLSGSGNTTPGGYGATMGGIFLSNTVLTIGSDGSSTIYDGVIQQLNGSTTGSLRKVGAGTFMFKGQSLLAGQFIVDGGAMVLDGSVANAVTVNAGGTLAGAGTLGAVTLNPGAFFLPGSTSTNRAVTNRMNTITADSLAFTGGATVTVNLYGPTNYTQIVVDGPVNLGGATLQVNLNYTPAPTDVFDIILNGSNGATTPGFAGPLLEGAGFPIGNGWFGQISYAATGDATPGNDVRISNLRRPPRGSVFMMK